ncbi:MAG: T9SS type A sorting domain-containing protein [Candidatus Stahlbacteria bacterium]|nr:T9SS type A sorting domain-containing protein [Candidatus Stahlbacteria bacterium]
MLKTKRKNYYKVWVFAIIITISGTLYADLDVFMGCKCWINTGTAGVWQREVAWDIVHYPDSTYIHASFCDLDNDGDYDAYVTDGASDFITAFENIGCDTVPIWQRKSEWDFNPPDMDEIFWAKFVDIDGDGKCELSATKHDTIKFYKDTANCAWKRVPAWDIYINEDNLGHSYADLDNDGDYDLMVRLWNSCQVKAFENIGSSTNPVWQEKPVWVPLPEPDELSLGDLDGDKDVDIIGGGSGWATSHENTGTITNPVWTQRSGWCTPDAHQCFYPELIDIDADGPSGVEENSKIETQKSQLEIYPNPFTKSTTIDIWLETKDLGLKAESSVSGLQSLVSLTIFDLSGRLVRSWDLGIPDPFRVGTSGNCDFHKVVWDGTDNNGKRAKAGIYFCKLQMDNYTVTKKLCLIK